MIIPTKSILHALPTKKISKHDLYFIEANISIIEMIDIHYENLFKLLLGSNKIADVSIIIEIWGIIDNFRKFRCLLNQLPGLKKKDPQIITYLKKIGTAENLRHFIQHFNKEIDNLNIKTLPPLGYISYAKMIDDKNVQSITIVPGYLRKYKGLQVVNPAGKEIRMNIDLITYYIGDHQINLSDLLYGTQEFIPLFEQLINSKILKNIA